MSIEEPQVFADISLPSIRKYLKGIMGDRSYQLDPDDLFQMEDQALSLMKEIFDGVSTKIMGVGGYGLVFRHPNKNYVCKFAAFLHPNNFVNGMWGEVSNWIYLSNLRSRGLVKSIEMKKFAILPFQELAEQVLDGLIMPFREGIDKQEQLETRPLNSFVKKLDIFRKEIKNVYDSNMYYCLLVEDRVKYDVHHFFDVKIVPAPTLDTLFLFEFLYFEWICWRYLGVVKINDSKLDNMGIEFRTAPISYKIGDTQFYFSGGTTFRRIDFGSLFTFENGEGILNSGIPVYLSEQNFEIMANKKKPDITFNMGYTFPGLTQQQIETDYSSLSKSTLNVSLFNETGAKRIVEDIKKNGLRMMDFEKRMKAWFEPFTAPRGNRNYEVINSNEYLASKKRKQIVGPESKTKQLKNVITIDDRIDHINEMHTTISSIYRK